MPRSFLLEFIDLYKQQLDRLGFSFTGREVLISNQQGTGLYLLLFAAVTYAEKSSGINLLKALCTPNSTWAFN